jgi:glutathione-regulated potassium-efflux system protein KefB
VDFQLRETFESAIAFGAEVLRGLGVADDEVAETMDDVRRRDRERLDLQAVGGITAGRALLRGNVATPEPAPLTTPRRETVALNPAAAAAIEDDATAGTDRGAAR